MIEKIRYFTLPVPIINEQKINPLTKGLHLCETGEIILSDGSIWSVHEKRTDILLLFCSKGEGIIKTDTSFPIGEGQYFILPAKTKFEFSVGKNKQTKLFTAWFNGENIRHIENEFSVVRTIIPSVRNYVANREMLFDEIFNNLAKGFHDENIEYINLCFGHLIATFLYAHKIKETDEDNPGHVVRRAISYFELNINKRLTLKQISGEVGYSTTYFSTIFRRETGYGPLAYFSHLKIVKACEYLDYTSAKVKQISFSLGYSDPYYFTRDFKKKMGLSPRQYRNRISARMIHRS